MISGSLIREARLRSGLTQQELGEKLGLAQSAIARWERDEAIPSLETLRNVIRACGLELNFSMSKFDDSNFSIIDDNLRLDTAQRFAGALQRAKFQERRRALNAAHND